VQQRAVDEPVGLWVAAHDRGRQQMLRHACALQCLFATLWL
jgi:hypothetical protein